MYLNKVILVANLTRDPELRALPSGMNVANFSVATNRTYRDRNGNKQDIAEFHNIVVFGKQADSCAQYLKKGASVLIEGRLQTRSWEKDGQKQYRTEVLAERVQFGPRRDVGAKKSNDADGGFGVEPDSVATASSDYPEDADEIANSIPF